MDYRDDKTATVNAESKSTQMNSSQSTVSTGAISLERLFFSFGTHPPALSEFTVYDSTSFTLSGRTFDLYIIGQSHFLRSRDGDFYELCSCIPLDEPDEGYTESISLSFGNEQAFGIAGDEIRYRIAVSVLSLDDFPRKDYDLSHRFDPDAFTTVDLSPPYFETYHTYSERDLVARTRSELLFPEAE